MTPKPPCIRVATSKDEYGIFLLAKMAHEENAVAPMDEGKVIDKIRLGTQGKGGLIGVADNGNGLEGIIMMELAQQWYSNEWFLSELFAFVHPAHRRTEHAKHLLQFSKWAAEQMAMPLHLGVLSGERMKAKVRFYRRHIRMSGALFVHNANYGNLMEPLDDNAI